MKKNLIKKKNVQTYSVDSTVGELGIIMSTQFVKIVVIIKNENKGCTNT